MDWVLWSQVAEVLGGISVVVAVVFGITQVRQFGQQRRDVAAVELMHSIEDGEFIRAVRLIYSLPDGEPLSSLRERGPEYEDAAFVICARFETVGLVVHRGSIPFELVEDLIGGMAVVLWRRLEPWAEGLRAERGHPQLWEWFQWLAEAFESRGRTAQAPAHASRKRP